MKSIFIDLFKVLLYSLLIISAIVFLKYFVFPYTAFDDNVSFLKYKQHYVHNPIWKAAFYIHVFSAIIALISGIPQFSKTILRDHKVIHRLLGKVYAWDILIVNFPPAMVLAVTAIGPWVSKLGFVILDFLWVFFTYRAVTMIKQGNISAHKHYMMRSYALTFSAITLRMWSTVFISILQWNPLIVYSVNAWMGFIPNLLFVEILIWREGRRKYQMSF